MKTAVPSRSGRRLAATHLAGSNLLSEDPRHSAHGRLTVLQVAGRALAPLAETAMPALCQGSAWSDDERTIVLQCAGPRTLAAYQLAGHRLAGHRLAGHRLLAPRRLLRQRGRPGPMAALHGR